MELKETIEKRRSIRKFTDYFVTDEEIKEVIEAARWAPSWSNTQSWTFVVVRDRGIIEQITETFSKSNPARQCAATASALIVACAKKNTAGCRNGVELTSIKNWFMFDMGAAVQNLCLRAYELGLATVIVGLLDHQGCKRILTVPGDYEVVTVIPIGKSAEKDRIAPARKAIDTMTYLDTFGKPYIK